MPTRRDTSPDPAGDSVPDAVASAAATPDACRRLLEEQHPVVAEAVRFVAARHRLARDVADELRSRVVLHIAANDYAALRCWRRECTLHTYLVTVATRVYLDYRNQEWGRTKPPALVRRLGPHALILWRLTHRRRLSFDDAVARFPQHLQDEPPPSREVLQRIYERFPPLKARYFVGTGDLDQREDPSAEADALVVAGERRALAERVEAALTDALAGLAADERLILRLFFIEGVSRASIARALRLDQPRLYPRFNALLTRLRAALAARGVTVSDMRDVVGLPDADPIQAALESASKNDTLGPSMQVDAESAPAPGPARGNRDQTPD